MGKSRQGQLSRGRKRIDELSSLFFINLPVREVISLSQERVNKGANSPSSAQLCPKTRSVQSVHLDSLLHGRKHKDKRRSPEQVLRALACTPKGLGFNSQSGHILGLQV